MNLTEVVVRDGDTFESLKKKVGLATILGTIQSTFTDFRYLRKIWQKNCEEERLLGVSLTGICDNLSVLTPENLEGLRNHAIEVNKVWAVRLGINQSTAITCVKPSGTVSQLVDSASGLHPRYSRYYLRTIRADNKDPLTQFLKDSGVYYEPALGKESTTTIFYFPMEAPEKAVTRHDLDGVQSLELWKTLQDHWCEHKPSASIYFTDDNVLDVASWVYRNFDILSGVAFFPTDEGNYKQAPYQELTKKEYDAFTQAHGNPTIEWSHLSEYETEDTTTGSQELACTGGTCDINSIG